MTLKDLLPRLPPAGPTPKFLDDIDDIKARVAAIEVSLREYGIGPPIGWTDEVDKILSGLTSRVTASETSSTTLQDKASRLEDSISELNSLIAALGNHQAVTEDSVAKLSDRVISSENSIKDLQNSVSELDRGMASHETAINTLISRLGTAGGLITDLRSLLTLWGNRFTDIGNELNALGEKFIPPYGHPDWERWRGWLGQFTAIGNEMKEIGRKFRTLGD